MVSPQASLRVKGNTPKPASGLICAVNSFKISTYGRSIFFERIVRFLLNYGALFDIIPPAGSNPGKG